MNQTTLVMIAVLIVVGGISLYRSGKMTMLDLVTAQDKLTTKVCIQMALQMLGSALEPDSAKSPAQAIAAGVKAVENQGMSCAIVVNVLLMGFLGGYAAKNQLNSDRTQALMFHGSSLLADGWKLSREELWDRSGELLKARGPLCFLVEMATRDGVSLPTEVERGSELAGLLTDAVKQAG